MPARDLSHFRKGATIALENIAEDYLLNANSLLLEVIQDLEDNRPIIGGKGEDWERRCVLDGGAYVFEAMRGLWAQAVEESGEDENSEERSTKRMGVVDVVEDKRRGMHRRAHEDAENELWPRAVYDKMESHDPQAEAAPNGQLNNDRSDLDQDDFEMCDADGDSGPSAEDKSTDGNEYERDVEEVQVVLNLLRLLARWIDEQTDEASESDRG